MIEKKKTVQEAAEERDRIIKSKEPRTRDASHELYYDEENKQNKKIIETNKSKLEKLGYIVDNLPYPEHKEKFLNIIKLNPHLYLDDPHYKENILATAKHYFGQAGADIIDKNI